MSVTRFTHLALISAAIILNANSVCGQSYPVRPVHIVTAEPGGVSDLSARLIAQGITPGLGQNAIVENHPTSLTKGLVARAQPDGYTVLISGPTLWIEPLLQGKTGDPLADVAPITLVVSSPNVLAIHPSLPVKSVKELIALAKARPGEINYASGANGSSPHLAAELFNSMAGIKTVRVAYKGTGGAVNSVTGGETQFLFAPVGAVSALIKAGRIKAIAVSSAQPSLLMPGTPTVAATGLPGYESNAVIAMFAPAKTPEAIIKRINQEVTQVLNKPDVKEKLLNSGVEAAPSTPEAMVAALRSEMSRYGKVIKEGGIKLE